MSEKRIVIAAGGTGGHLFPATALARQLKSQVSLLFIGGGLSRNRFFQPEEFAYRDVSCGRVSLLGAAAICRGAWQSWQLLKQFNPDLVIGFGSYYTLPVLLAAKLGGFPFVLHEQNSVPGRVNRLFSGSALLTAVHFPEAKDLLKGKSLEVEMPLQLEQVSKILARRYYGLGCDRPVVLVFGGSQGAEAINALMGQACDFQVIHFTGNAEWTQTLKERYQQAGVRACVKDFETQMPFAWQAADLVVSRAGAGTVAEQLAYEVPGILIPYPHAMDQHQDKNADYMVEVGGAVKWQERALTPQLLIEQIHELLEKNKEMKEKIRYHKAKRKVPQFYDCVKDLLGKHD